MKRHLIVGLAAGFILGMMFAAPAIEAGIPPTRAFSQIFVGSSNVTADSYNANFSLVTQGSITSSVSNEDISIKLIQKTCPPGQFFNAVGANGTLLCG